MPPSATTAAYVAGQEGALVVPQSVVLGLCETCQAWSVQVKTVSQRTSGSLPYSQSKVMPQKSPAAGIESGHPALPVTLVTVELVADDPVTLDPVTLVTDEALTEEPVTTDELPTDDALVAVDEDVGIPQSEPSAGPVAYPDGTPHPVLSVVPHPQTSSSDLHTGLPGAGFSMH
jgi:hypothetical protein